ncbi:citrate:proton symporter [Streptomyces sp. NPDC005181]|uniref:citrate:proton symporter n=1 Tax=Streptomyces sp. NPDC005181 TaxID=3156869 RepID=UPI0033AA0092
MLAALGFSTIGLFLLLTMTKRVSVLVALVLLPVLAALVGGFAGEMGDMVLTGLATVAPTGIMIAFAVLYFTLMVDAGLFDPLIRQILRAARNDPARIAVGTAVLTMCVSLDGDGASTFLITVSALLPVYKRLGMSPLVLSGTVCLGAGVMNMIPWGGPTVRAMAALKLDSSEVFTSVLPAMGLGIAWVLLASYWIGRRERRRLGAPMPQGKQAADRKQQAETQPAYAAGDGPGTPLVPPVTRRRIFLTVFNAALTVVLLVGLVMEVMPLPVLFAVAFAMALLVNHPTWEGQQALLEKHAKSVVLVTTLIFAAGAFTGVLTGTKMISEMAKALVSVVPDSLGGHHRNAAEPGLHPGRLLLRRAARAVPHRVRIRQRPGRSRQGRHPRPDDHRLPAQPAHRLHLHPRRHERCAARRAPALHLRLGLCHHPRDDCHGAGHRGHLALNATRFIPADPSRPA